MRTAKENRSAKKPRTYTAKELLELTHFVIQGFYNRRISEILPYFDENFVWIGAWDYQYVRGIDSFLASTDTESQSDPAIISDEEYNLLTHEGKLWVVYGRYTATVFDENHVSLSSRTRNTYVWKQCGDRMLLLHIHGSNAQDVPFSSVHPATKPPEYYGDWPRYLSAVQAALMGQRDRPLVCIRDLDAGLHYLSPQEISYIYSNKNIRYIKGGHGDPIPTRMTLDSLAGQFSDCLRIHRSYLVNPIRIRSLKRYEITLDNGEILPVGKERFLELREMLAASYTGGAAKIPIDKPDMDI